jgi:hypothetical protein
MWRFDMRALTINEVKIIAGGEDVSYIAFHGPFPEFPSDPFPGPLDSYRLLAIPPNKLNRGGD